MTVTQLWLEIVWRLHHLNPDHTTAVSLCVCYSHCGDVLAREGVGSVADEQACFTHSPKEEKTEGNKKQETLYN